MTGHWCRRMPMAGLHSQPPRRVGERSWPRAGIRPRAESDPVPGREWPDLADGVAQLPIEEPHAPPRSPPPHEWYMAENGLTVVNNITRLDSGPGSSQGEDLLAACLKVLTSDNFSAELMALPIACDPICMNQAAMMLLLAVMPTLDDIDIAAVHRGNLFRGVVIPGTDVSSGLGGATGGHGGAVIGRSDRWPGQRPGRRPDPWCRRQF
jgi:hypothetical protein